MVGIIKGDIRYTYLSNLLKNAILSDKLENLVNIKVLVLPLGGINTDYSIKQSNLNLLDILMQNSISTIVCGYANRELKELCTKRDIFLFELLNDEGFVRENAFLTAKGLINLLNLEGLDFHDVKVLILGFGNIGYYLAKLLSEYGTNFSIFTLDKKEEKFLKLMEYQFEQNVSDDYTLIINTIPQNLNVDYQALTKARIVDVASAPYGFDITKIIENNLKYEVNSAIPTKYAPLSAAIIIKKYIDFLITSC